MTLPKNQTRQPLFKNQTAGATLENNAMEAKFTYVFAEGSFETKLPTIWTDEKAEVGRVREEKRKRREEKRREEKRREEKEAEDRRQKTEDAGARKGSKVAKHYVFPMICGSGG